MAKRGEKIAERPGNSGFLALEGRQIAYQVVWSSARRRSYGFTVDKQGVIQFRAPRWVRLEELLAFAQRRKRFILNRLREKEARDDKARALLDLGDTLCALPDDWFRRAARRMMDPRLRAWARAVGVEVGTLRITSGRTVWGSCNAAGNISLSWRLLQVPAALREYVILHEVCHRRHMNHGVRFWALVEKHMPDYLERRRALAKMGGEIG